MLKLRTGHEVYTLLNTHACSHTHTERGNTIIPPPFHGEGIKTSYIIDNPQPLQIQTRDITHNFYGQP